MKGEGGGGQRVTYRSAYSDILALITISKAREDEERWVA